MGALALGKSELRTGWVWVYVVCEGKGVVKDGSEVLDWSYLVNDDDSS